MSGVDFPAPPIADEMRPFFDALAQHRFVLMRCRQCGAWYWPFSGCRFHDNEAFLANMEWAEASGCGTVHTFTIPQVPFFRAFPPPYVYAIVELEEGPIMPTNIIGCAPEAVRVGMPVSIVYEAAPNGLVLAKFKPA